MSEEAGPIMLEVATRPGSQEPIQEVVVPQRMQVDAAGAFLGKIETGGSMSTTQEREVYEMSGYTDSLVAESAGMSPAELRRILDQRSAELTDGIKNDAAQLTGEEFLRQCRDGCLDSNNSGVNMRDRVARIRVVEELRASQNPGVTLSEIQTRLRAIEARRGNGFPLGEALVTPGSKQRWERIGAGITAFDPQDFARLIENDVRGNETPVVFRAMSTQEFEEALKHGQYGRPNERQMQEGVIWWGERDTDSLSQLGGSVHVGGQAIWGGRREGVVVAVDRRAVAAAQTEARHESNGAGGRVNARRTRGPISTRSTAAAYLIREKRSEGGGREYEIFTLKTG